MSTFEQHIHSYDGWVTHQRQERDMLELQCHEQWGLACYLLSLHRVRRIDASDVDRRWNACSRVT